MCNQTIIAISIGKAPQESNLMLLAKKKASWSGKNILRISPDTFLKSLKNLPKKIIN